MAQRRWRRAALLAAVVPAAPGLLLALASPAEAAFRGGITSPSDGLTVSSHTTVVLSAEVYRDNLIDGSPTSTFAVRVPGESQARTLAQSNSWSNNKQTFSFPLSTSCPSYPNAPCGGVPARNGSYQVILSGPVNQTRHFSVRVAPAPPSGAKASVTGERQITVTWNRNPEPDVVSYDLFGGNGELIAGDLPTSPTSYVVNLPESNYGGEHSFAVRARRSAAPGSSETLTSPLSNAASVTVTEPTPEPDPSTDPGGGGGTDPGDGSTDPGEDYGSGGGGGGNGGGDSGSGTGGNTGGGGNGGGDFGSGTGGNTGGGKGSGGGGGDFSSGNGGGGGVAAPDPVAQQRRAFGLTFKSFSPKLGAPKLPPLPQFAEIEEPDGTFDPTIDYGDQEVMELAGEEDGTVQAMFEDVVSTVFEGRRLWTSLAMGLVLMLGAGHVRVWLGNTETD